MRIGGVIGGGMRSVGSRARGGRSAGASPSPAGAVVRVAPGGGDVVVLRRRCRLVDFFVEPVGGWAGGTSVGHSGSFMGAAPLLKAAYTSGEASGNRRNCRAITDVANKLRFSTEVSAEMSAGFSCAAAGEAAGCRRGSDRCGGVLVMSVAARRRLRAHVRVRWWVTLAACLQARPAAGDEERFTRTPCAIAQISFQPPGPESFSAPGNDCRRSPDSFRPQRPAATTD